MEDVVGAVRGGVLGGSTASDAKIGDGGVVAEGAGSEVAGRLECSSGISSTISPSHCGIVESGAGIGRSSKCTS